MTPHKQLFAHAPEQGVFGDCHRTCLACLFDMEPQEVPNFGEFYENNEEFDKAEKAWLASQGYAAIHVIFECSLEQLLAHQASINPGRYYLLGGISKNGFGHSVIACGGAIVWDPGTGSADHCIVSPFETGYYWLTFLVPDWMTQEAPRKQTPSDKELLILSYRKATGNWLLDAEECYVHVIETLKFLSPTAKFDNFPEDYEVN